MPIHWKSQNDIVAISAHNGGSEKAAPATYEAYNSSVAAGAEYVEFDIRRTADDILVVYHNARTGPAGRLVADLQYNELCENAAYNVPRVDDIIQLLAGKVMAHLDLKEIGYEEEVISLAREVLGPGNFIATTEEDVSITNIKRAFPDTTTALSVGRDARQFPWHRWPNIYYDDLFPLQRIRACGADWVATHHKLARLGVLKLCYRHGIGSIIWTVNSDALIDRFLSDQRVNILTTNRPQYASRRRSDLVHQRSR